MEHTRQSSQNNIHSSNKNVSSSSSSSLTSSSVTLHQQQQHQPNPLLQRTQKSAFQPQQQQQSSKEESGVILNKKSFVGQNSSSSNSQDQYDRTLKVAKKYYSDHGSHGLILQNNNSIDNNNNNNNNRDNSSNSYTDNSNSSIDISGGSKLLKKMTTSLQELYNDVPLPDAKEMVNVSVVDDSVEEDNQYYEQQQQQNQQLLKEATSSKINTSTQSNSETNDNHNKNKPITSLLHAALQQQEQQQQTNVDHQPGTHKDNQNKEQKECLTNPSDPHSNNGLDNSEGNLIVHKYDMIQVVNKNIRYHDNVKNNKSSSSPAKNTTSKSNTIDPLGVTSYQVLDILGQGTFAQVFKCQNIHTKEVCAVKIVKNKPAYTRQAAVEIDIFNALSSNDNNNNNSMVIHLMEQNVNDSDNDYMVKLLSYFMYQSHLCLVFELLGLNLYELLKRRQFRGLPISTVRSLVKQAIRGTNILSEKNIVHCDLKPENILIVSDEHVDCLVNGGKNCNNQPTTTNTTKNTNNNNNVNCTSKTARKNATDEFDHKIKLIDFGSACFEGQAAHTYIQSRFYRSPEVLLGIDYDGAIDMWSLGCVAAELFLGLPILPGIHEHDQICRICEMIGDIPEWMVEQGKKSSKYFKLEETIPTEKTLNIIQAKEMKKMKWKIKTREEFIASLSEEEKKRFGGHSKLEQQPTNRYFKKKLLSDIVMNNGNHSSAAEKEALVIFIHFLKGILNPDPCERWTAFQASTHPFITGITFRRRNSAEANIGIRKMKITNDIHWSTPWDPSVCRRILSLKRNKNRSGPSNLHKSLETHKEEGQSQTDNNRSSHLVSPTSRVTDMASSLSLSFDQFGNQTPPPTHPNQRQVLYPHVYQTPLSVSSSTHPISNISQYRQPPTSLSVSLHTPLNLQLDPDRQAVSNQVIVPTMTSISAQSFSESFYSGNMHQELRGDLGYALLRPGVVPTGPPAGGHLRQIPVINPIFVQQHIPNPPNVYPVQSYINSSTYNGTNDMGQFVSNQQMCMSPRFVGPISPQNHHTHHVHVPQDDFMSHGSYTHGSNQSQHRQQYSYDPGYDDYLNQWSDPQYNNFRGRSM